MPDTTYFQKRALQEENAARAATCPKASERHAELAAMYRYRCQLLAEEEMTGPTFRSAFSGFDTLPLTGAGLESSPT